MPRILPLIPFLLAILYAPLVYGCTVSWAIWGLDGLLGAGVLLWLLRKIQDGGHFHLAPLPAGLTLLLGAIAVAQVFNPHSVFDPKTWDLRALEGGLPYLPRTIDRATSLSRLPHGLILGAGFLALVDLMHSRENRWLVLRTVAISGVIVAIWGMVQKAAGGDALLWSHLWPGDHTYFGGYRYHAHAVAFLNLCWPASLALFLRTYHQEKRYLARNGWGLCWLFTFGALFVNTSKFGHALALPLLGLAAICFFRALPGEWLRLSWRNGLVVLVLILAIGSLAVPSLSSSVGTWRSFLEMGDSLKGRQQVFGVCVDMARDAPLFGFGMGSFRILFPYYAVSLGNRLGPAIWSHAHQDYLQTVIEWGKAGVLLWGALLFLPLAREMGRCLGRLASLTGAAALVGTAAVLLHAWVDFPLQIASLQYLLALHLAVLWRPHAHR